MRILPHLLTGLVLTTGLISTACSENTPTGDGHASKPTMGAFKGGKPTVYPDWFKESFLEFADDVAEAADEGKRIMIVFHQDSCPYCNALIEDNFSEPAINALTQKKFDVVALNMWGDREIVTVDGKPIIEKDFALALKVQYTPTILFLNEQGKIALRLNGYLPPQTFKQALDFIADHKEGEGSFRDYVKANALTHTAGKELRHEDFFIPLPADLSTQSDKPLAIFFEQGDCEQCDYLHNTALKDKVTRKLIDQFICVQLDMWGDQKITTPDGQTLSASEWAKQLDVNYAPSVVLFNQDGKEVIRTEAAFKTFHTQSIFDYVLSGSYRTEPSFQRYISARADHIREQGIDVDIWR